VKAKAKGKTMNDLYYAVIRDGSGRAIVTPAWKPQPEMSEITETTDIAELMVRSSFMEVN
jgi:hypothetical protein